MANAFNIPHFLKAKSALELQKAMLLNNTALNKEHHYFDIKCVNKSWYAWYYKNIRNAAAGY